jgi:hypothetical protein
MRANLSVPHDVISERLGANTCYRGNDDVIDNEGIDSNSLTHTPTHKRLLYRGKRSITYIFSLKVGPNSTSCPIALHSGFALLA